jgi:ribose transport system ATP-binding protein
VADLGAAEAKIVEIMKALASHAEVLVLDEPTAALPERDVESLFAVIRSLREDGVTVIYISHRLEEIFSIADRVSVLKDGALVGTWRVADIDRDSLVRSMVGRELTDAFPRRARPAGAPVVLSAHGLADGRALRGVSFELHAGEILGIGGMTGNGQRECIRALFGAHPLREGTIRFQGKAVRIDSPVRAVELGIGFIPDDRRNEGLSITQPVARNIALPSLHLRQAAGVILRRKERRDVERIVRELEIKLSSVSQSVQSMSGGNQQRVVIGKWLPLEPKVLLFHEPTLGIDVGARAEIYRLMRELTSRGVSILMVTSDMIELLNVPDRILVFLRGRIGAEFAGGEASEEAVMFAASGGAGEAGGGSGGAGAEAR